MLNALWQGLLDLVYPRLLGCIYCGKEKSLSDFELCTKCMSSIEFVRGPACAKCGKPAAAGMMLCSDCALEPRTFMKAFPVALYRGWLKDAIYAYKFDKRTELAKPFARLMSGRILRAGLSADGIIPVPMHRERLKHRRFNHAELLARHLGEFIDLPVWPQVLYRAAEKLPQHKLNRLDRERNTEDAYQVRGADIIQGRTVILIDDIYTTGFTAQACAAALLKSGAKAVMVSVLAIGTDQSRILQNNTEYML
jgi:ComF family protein